MQAIFDFWFKIISLAQRKQVSYRSGIMGIFFFFSFLFPLVKLSDWVDGRILYTDISRWLRSRLARYITSSRRLACMIHSVTHTHTWFILFWGGRCGGVGLPWIMLGTWVLRWPAGWRGKGEEGRFFPHERFRRKNDKLDNDGRSEMECVCF